MDGFALADPVHDPVFDIHDIGETGLAGKVFGQDLAAPARPADEDNLVLRPRDKLLQLGSELRIYVAI